MNTRRAARWQGKRLRAQRQGADHLELIHGKPFEEAAGGGRGPAQLQACR